MVLRGGVPQPVARAVLKLVLSKPEARASARRIRAEIGAAWKCGSASCQGTAKASAERAGAGSGPASVGRTAQGMRTTGSSPPAQKRTNMQTSLASAPEAVSQKKGKAPQESKQSYGGKGNMKKRREAESQASRTR
eukprot:scaffold5903_cov20-Tisochrysis_lutea.AAC.2